MGFKFGRQSNGKLGGVHPDLVKVARRAIEISPVDFEITEGLRSVSRQKQMVAEGKSQTMTSRHLTGKAVDVVALVNGKASWDKDLYEKIAEAFKQAAIELGIAIVWGGDWKTLVDADHFELDRKIYP